MSEISTIPFQIFKTSHFPYRGTIASKYEILVDYKFTVCYENSIENGYISKIFDSFFAGSIPIYSGAPNVKDYIPSSCFIDLNLFDTFDDLYSFLDNMSHSDYIIYRRSIFDFLNSESVKKFYAEEFVKKVESQIKKII